MNLNIDNFKKLNKNINKLIAEKNQIQNILIWNETEPENEIYINYDFFNYLKKEKLYNILDNKYTDFIIEKEKELNNIELNILYQTNSKYKRIINKLLKEKEKEEAKKQLQNNLDNIIDFESKMYLDFENQLYNDYLIAI